MKLYIPIQAEEYDAETFREAYEKLGTIQGGLETLAKDPNNFKAISGLGNILHGDSEFFYAKFDSPETAVRKFGSIAASEGKNAMNNYVNANSEQIYEGLDKEHFMTFLENSKPVEDSKDEGYQEVIKTLSELREIMVASQDPEKMREFVSDAFEVEGMPKWFKQASEAYMGSSRYIEPLFMEFVAEHQEKIKKLFDSVDESDLRKYGKMNLDYAKKNEDKSVLEILGELAYKQMSK